VDNAIGGLETNTAQAVEFWEALDVRNQAAADEEGEQPGYST
jgi:hypothetical protein